MATYHDFEEISHLDSPSADDEQAFAWADEDDDYNDDDDPDFDFIF